MQDEILRRGGRIKGPDNRDLRKRDLVLALRRLVERLPTAEGTHARLTDAEVRQSIGTPRVKDLRKEILGAGGSTKGPNNKDLRKVELVSVLRNLVSAGTLYRGGSEKMRSGQRTTDLDGK